MEQMTLENQIEVIKMLGEFLPDDKLGIQGKILSRYEVKKESLLISLMSCWTQEDGYPTLIDKLCWEELYGEVKYFPIALPTDLEATTESIEFIKFCIDDYKYHIEFCIEKITDIKTIDTLFMSKQKILQEKHTEEDINTLLKYWKDQTDIGLYIFTILDKVLWEKIFGECDDFPLFCVEVLDSEEEVKNFINGFYTNEEKITKGN